MNKDNRSIGLGIPTMLVIFVILGMCILSLLSYLTAVNNNESVQRECDYALNYYEADSRAQYELDSNEGDISFKIEMENGLYLEVERKDGVITEYCVKEVKE